MGFCTRQGNAFLLRQWQRGGLCPSCSSAHRFSPHDCWQLSKKQGSGRLISVKGWTSVSGVAHPMACVFEYSEEKSLFREINDRLLISNKGFAEMDA